MPWIESHTVLLRHRKTIMLANALGIKPVHAIGHLHALWHNALEQQEDGDLSGWPNGMIARMAAFEGNEDGFVRALNACGWLDEKILHDWLDYAGPYLAKKYHNSRRRFLQDIWIKHDRRYGKHKGISTSLRKQKGSKKETAPILYNVISSNLISDLKEGDCKGEGQANRVTRLMSDDFMLPDWMPQSEWQEFLAHRKRKRAPVTETIAKRIINVLRELMGLGHAPAAVLSEAIDRNWTAIKVDWIHNQQSGGGSNGRVAEPKGFAALREFQKIRDGSPNGR